MADDTQDTFPDGYLELEDGKRFQGQIFGHHQSAAGDLVFNTGMTGYPETFTDPSYTGQIVTLTYPLIGNYGVPPIGIEDNLSFGAESESAHVRGIVVADYSEEFSHWEAHQSLDTWLKAEKVPAITGVDTRAVTKLLRFSGTTPARIIVDGEIPEFDNPDATNLVAQVSIKEPHLYGGGKGNRVLLIDCGCKTNIVRSLIDRNVEVLRVPWNFDVTSESFDGVLISNGPGDPTKCKETIENIKKLFSTQKPVFGICLGHQLMALAAGAKTYKLKFGHRSQNQPCIDETTGRCYITSQNHGYTVDGDTLPIDWQSWFVNANDKTNAGIRHTSEPFFSVQFHPEAFPGPNDTGYLFDDFIDRVTKKVPGTFFGESKEIRDERNT